MFRIIWHCLFGDWGACFEHEWKIIGKETLDPIKMKYLLKLLPKLSSDQFVDIDKVTYVTYQCTKCNDFKQKKLEGRVKVDVK